MSTMSLHNREVAVANAICHDRNVKRAYEIHNAKINAVHSTSTLSSPDTYDFLDLKISKNYHAKRRGTLRVRVASKRTSSATSSE